MTDLQGSHFSSRGDGSHRQSGTTTSTLRGSATAASTLLPGSVRSVQAAQWPVRQKRTWFQQGGSIPSGLCLAKAAIGSGVLTMVTQCAEVGLAVMTVLLAAGVVLTVLSIRMIGEASIATRCGSFEDICDELLHPYISFFTGLANAVNGISVATTYLYLCGQAWATLSSQDGPQHVAIIFCGIGICLPMSICRKVTVMRYVALVSLCGTLFLIISMLIIPSMQEHDPASNDGSWEPLSFEEMWFHHNATSPVTYMTIVNAIIWSYNCQSVVPQLTAELESEAWNSVNGMAWISTVICFVIYFTVSVVGVYAFGSGFPASDNLVLLFKPYAAHAIVQISLLAVMVSLMCCLEFQIFPVRQFFAWCIRKARRRSRGEELTDRVWCRVSCTRWFDILGAFLTVSTATFLATQLTDLSQLLSFVGGFCGTYICYVIPSIWLIALRKRDGEWSPKSLDGIVAIGLLTIGVVLFVLGTTASIVQALNNSGMRLPFFQAR